MPADQPVSVRLGKSLVKELKLIAKNEQRPLASLIRLVLTTYASTVKDRV